MSRVAKAPISVPSSVQVTVNGQVVSVKGGSAELKLNVNSLVMPVFENGILSVKPVVDTTDANAQAGTARALLANMVNGVSKGFERKLELVGVGYRAAMQGKDLSLSLGFSHPVVFKAPEGITLATPTQTEIE